VIDSAKWQFSAQTKLILVVCFFVAIVDFTLRVFPQSDSDDISTAAGEVKGFERLAPSEAWLGWYSDVIEAAEAAAEVERVREEQRRAREIQAAEFAAEKKPEEQMGDVTLLRLGEFNYRLWGVFNKTNQESGADVFGVLKGDDETIQVRNGDTLGTYKVKQMASRSITFESVTDKRVVTLWLFGKGPR